MHDGETDQFASGLRPADHAAKTDQILSRIRRHWRSRRRPVVALAMNQRFRQRRWSTRRGPRPVIVVEIMQKNRCRRAQDTTGGTTPPCQVPDRGRAAHTLGLIRTRHRFEARAPLAMRPWLRPTWPTRGTYSRPGRSCAQPFLGAGGGDAQEAADHRSGESVSGALNPESR